MTPTPGHDHRRLSTSPSRSRALGRRPRVPSPVGSPAGLRRGDARPARDPDAQPREDSTAPLVAAAKYERLPRAEPSMPRGDSPASYTDIGHIDYLVTKKEMGVIVEHLLGHTRKARNRQGARQLKDLCYRFATQSGITVSIDDVRTPTAKKGMMDEYERRPTRSRRSSVEASSPTASAVSRKSHLDRCHRRGASRDGARVQRSAVQPDRHDGRLGCSRKHDADASDRRHAWPRRQPSW